MAPAKPKKPVIKPSLPLRGLFWGKVPDAKIDETVWADLSDEHIRLDVEALEKTFCKKQTAAKKAPAEGASAKPAKPKAINLLDGKRQQNGGICIAKLKMNNEKLKAAVMGMDDTVLTLDNIQMLLGLCPNKEEADMLQNYDGDMALLGKVDKFSLGMVELPHFKQRLQSLVVKHRFGDNCSELMETVRVVSLACEELSESKKFTEVLETILAIGNYLNGSTSRGGAYGFKLAALGKLGTIKSVDNKKNLVTFLVDMLHKSNPDCCSLSNDVAHIAPAIRISVTQIKADVNGLSKSVNDVVAQLDWAEKDQDEADMFHPVISAFTEKAVARVKTLKTAFAKLEHTFNELALSFGEIPTKTDSCDFFKEINSFFKEFDKEVEKQAAAEAKAARDAKRAASSASTSRARSSDAPSMSRQSAETAQALGADGGETKVRLSGASEAERRVFVRRARAGVDTRRRVGFVVNSFVVASAMIGAMTL